MWITPVKVTYKRGISLNIDQNGPIFLHTKIWNTLAYEKWFLAWVVSDIREKYIWRIYASHLGGHLVICHPTAFHFFYVQYITSCCILRQFNSNCVHTSPSNFSFHLVSKTCEQSVNTKRLTETKKNKTKTKNYPERMLPASL